MVQTTHTAGVTTRTTVHDLSINGRAGAVLFLLMFSILFFIIAFATAGWVGDLNRHAGLWESCSRGAVRDDDWHLAVQVMMCIALVALIIALILIFLYLFVLVSKYRTLLGLVIVSFIAFVMMFIAIVVYGVKASEYNNLYWSYGLACISTILCLCAAIIAAIQLKKA